MDLAEAIAYGQKLSDLYGLTYYIYPTSDGTFMATPEMGWTPTYEPIYVACHNIVAECVTRSPLSGADRLEEEVQSFLRTWR